MPISEYPYRVRKSTKKATSGVKESEIYQHNSLARTIEAYLNEIIKGGHRGNLSYTEIANATKIPRDDVSKVLFYVDCRSSGVNIDENIRVT